MKGELSRLYLPLLLDLESGHHPVCTCITYSCKVNKKEVMRSQNPLSPLSGERVEERGEMRECELESRRFLSFYFADDLFPPPQFDSAHCIASPTGDGGAKVNAINHF
jgi:hypothetical protein